VKDNGIGFDMKYGEVIFKPFHQLNITPAYEGTGLGRPSCTGSLPGVGEASGLNQNQKGSQVLLHP